MDFTRREFGFLALPHFWHLRKAFGQGQRAKILLNPGHNKNSTKYGYGRFLKRVGYEYVLATRISDKIREELAESGEGLEVLLTRDDKSVYAGGIQNFFDAHQPELKGDVQRYRAAKNISNNMPLEEAALQLAMLKWAELNNFDLILNIHVDDVDNGKREAYGFSVIASDRNHASNDSMELGRSVYNSLKQHPLIRKGNETQNRFFVRDLVMLGSDLYIPRIPSIIIECGFIGQLYQGGKTIADEQVQRVYASQIASGVISYLRGKGESSAAKVP